VRRIVVFEMQVSSTTMQRAQTLDELVAADPWSRYADATRDVRFSRS
jgi:hypothetical protein